MKSSFFFTLLFFIACSSTPSYTLVSGDFYSDSSGQLFILTTGIEPLPRYLWEQPNDDMATSAPFYRAVPNIDPKTYQVLGETGYYAKDKLHIYKIIDMTDGRHIFVIKDADPSTFKSIGHRLGKDKNFTFSNGLIVNDSVTAEVPLDNNPSPQ